MVMAFAALRGNLARVREEVAEIQAREGVRGPVRIVGITKGHPAAAARAALAAELADVGENRMQEALAKQEELAELPLRWHFVGHLQTNKAKHVPGRFVLVHSVDSVRLARAVGRAAAQRGEGEPLAVLVQVNVAGEEQKSGCAPSDAIRVAEAVRGVEAIRLRGLMTMAPLTDDEAVQRRVFADLRRLREALEGEGYTVPELSMGMSNDYRAAVAEGATILRLGTVLFGERPT